MGQSGLYERHPDQYEQHSHNVSGPVGPGITSDQLGDAGPKAGDRESGAHQGEIGSYAGHPGTLQSQIISSFGSRFAGISHA
jgi:hypothetical protein